MRRSIALALLAALAAASTAVSMAGCAHLGANFETSEVNRITVGSTNQEGIRAWFGEPTQVGLDDGRLAWTYFYYDLRLIGEHHSKELYVVFNADLTVHSFTFHTSFAEEKALVQPSR